MFDLERKSKPTCLLRRRAADGGRPLRIALFTWESLHTIAVGGVISLHARARSCLCGCVRARAHARRSCSLASLHTCHVQTL